MQQKKTKPVCADTDRLFHLNLVDLNTEQFVCEVIVGVKCITVLDIFTLQCHTHTLTDRQRD